MRVNSFISFVYVDTFKNKSIFPKYNNQNQSSMLISFFITRSLSKAPLSGITGLCCCTCEIQDCRYVEVPDSSKLQQREEVWYCQSIF